MKFRWSMVLDTDTARMVISQVYNGIKWLGMAELK